jgi:hypothetical protein
MQPQGSESEKKRKWGRKEWEKNANSYLEEPLSKSIEVSLDKF